MDENNNAPNFIRYPPNSNPPKKLTNSEIIKEKFVKQGASMLPKLEDFNQMFRNRADNILGMDKSVFPPGHPLYNRENSISSLKQSNDKLLKENLELKKKLEGKTGKKVNHL